MAEIQKGISESFFLVRKCKMWPIRTPPIVVSCNERKESDSNGTRTHSHLFRKRTRNHLVTLN